MNPDTQFAAQRTAIVSLARGKREEESPTLPVLHVYRKAAWLLFFPTSQVYVDAWESLLLSFCTVVLFASRTYLF